MTSGHTFTYTDFYQSDVSTQVGVEYTSSTGALTYADFITIPASATWTQATLTFTAPAGTASVRVLHVLASIGSLTIDDASLADQAGGTPPPPPTNLVANPSFAAANATDATLPQNWSKDFWGTNNVAFTSP